MTDNWQNSCFTDVPTLPIARQSSKRGTWRGRWWSSNVYIAGSQWRTWYRYYCSAHCVLFWRWKEGVDRRNAKAWHKFSISLDHTAMIRALYPKDIYIPRWCTSYTSKRGIGPNHRNQIRIGPGSMANILTHLDWRSPDQIATFPMLYITLILHRHFTVPIPFCLLLQYLRWSP